MKVIFGVDVPTNEGLFMSNDRAGEKNFGILKEEGTINITAFYGTRGQRGQGANEKE